MTKVICHGLSVPTSGNVCGPISVSEVTSQPPTSRAMPLPATVPMPITEIGFASLSRVKMSLVIE